MDDFDFTGQVAIVTGAGGGIGRSIAMLLAQRGAKVLVNDYGGDPFGASGNSGSATAVAVEIKKAGGDAVANDTAVGSVAAAQSIRDAALEAFGRIDILVNNAGIQTYGEVDAIADVDLERVIETNYLGPYRLLRAVWPVMRKQGYGRILNVSSNTSLGFGGMAPYASSKSAILGLTADTGREGAPLGIMVNSLLPAAATRLAKTYPDAASTLMASFNKWLEDNFQPEKVAAAAIFLVSNAVDFSGEHFSAGAGRVSRIAHIATNGFHASTLTPEAVAANINQIRDTSVAKVVTSGAEELQGYQGVAPFESA